MTKIICSECKAPDDNMMLAVPRSADSKLVRRPMCSSCYGDPRALDEDGNVPEFRMTPIEPSPYQEVFVLQEMPSPIPDDLVDWHAKWWGTEGQNFFEKIETPSTTENIGIDSDGEYMTDGKRW